jgi:hypothetical protein
VANTLWQSIEGQSRELAAENEIMIYRALLSVLTCALSLCLPSQATPNEGALGDDLDSLLGRTRRTQIEAERFLEGLHASEESLLLPANDRLVVVFLKQAAGVDALLHKVELRIDNQIAETYRHQIGDLEKMLNGAIIPLYAGLLSVGKHTIVVSITGMEEGEGRGAAEAVFSFESGAQSHFIEITVTRGEGIEFEEWR